MNKLSFELQERIAKKINKILEHPETRHLMKADCFVGEVGQFRIIYRVFKEKNEVKFYFAGNHKDYEKWLKQFF